MRGTSHVVIWIPAEEYYELKMQLLSCYVVVFFCFHFIVLHFTAFLFNNLVVNIVVIH